MMMTQMESERNNREDFLGKNGFIPMRARDSQGRLVFTKYYISPEGEIVCKTNDGDGYKRMGYSHTKDGVHDVQINVCGDHRRVPIHRLVAENFIPNPDPVGHPFVSHINGDLNDNRASNLHWISKTERADNIRGVIRSIKPMLEGPILQIRRNGDGTCHIVNRFSCKRDLPTNVDGSKKILCRDYVSACCKNFRYFRTYLGYIWVYEKDLKKLPYKIV